MANRSSSNFTNISKPFANITMDAEGRNVSPEVGVITTIIINSITCPFTVLLNVLVIMAVKRRPRIRSKANILLACLAVTDASAGLIVQPSFILWKTLQIFAVRSNGKIGFIHNSFIRAISVCSLLHLMLITFERLIAIKCTWKHPYFVTNRKIKWAVIALWAFSFSCEVFRRIEVTKTFSKMLLYLVLISCIVFITVSYIVLYRETIRHQNMIKTQQLPQEEAERFAKESKTLKTTVVVVGTVVLCFLPIPLAFLSSVMKLDVAYNTEWIRTFAMLNSLFNPLIYCWRRKEMRQFVLRISPPAVEALN